MKVILMQDVKGTGKKGQTVEVSDGHAKNFLIPRKVAVEATQAHVSEFAAKKKSEENKRAKDLEEAQELAKKIEEMQVKIEAKIGENGKLFGSITNKEIAEALEKQHKLAIDKKKITLDDAIKTVGEKTVDVKLHMQVTAKLKVLIG